MRFEELAWQDSPLGEISLRRRWDPRAKRDVLEVKLGDEYLMSSMFTLAEEELARLGLALLAADQSDLSVAVGGLGLGYTAITALDDPRVASLVVIDAIPEVIEWHRDGLIPAGERLATDPRCRLVHGDFFALAAGVSLDPEQPGRRFDAILLDVDHSPRHVLHPRHAAFYERPGLEHLATHLRPGGVFALWSNDPPDKEFLDRLASTFTTSEAHVVEFANPLQGGTSTNTVYTATTPG
ncbi:polyamine aminopropyltransferase [Lolliginicoccus suaedae]|uniref:spermidine synthase n=1 Tax=Lolliginicoccus suaedae TaxID=2605429 RepID=UPI0011EE77C9|nr:spermidine synthase [Lolliginicoccus suaedae]